MSNLEAPRKLIHSSRKVLAIGVAPSPYDALPEPPMGLLDPIQEEERVRHPDIEAMLEHFRSI